MKNRNFFLAAAASILALAGCNKEIDYGPAKVEVDKTEIEVPKDAGSVTVSLNATIDDKEIAREYSGILHRITDNFCIFLMHNHHMNLAKPNNTILSIVKIQLFCNAFCQVLATFDKL